MQRVGRVRPFTQRQGPLCTHGKKPHGQRKNGDKVLLVKAWKIVFKTGGEECTVSQTPSCGQYVHASAVVFLSLLHMFVCGTRWLCYIYFEVQLEDVCVYNHFTPRRACVFSSTGVFLNKRTSVAPAAVHQRNLGVRRLAAQTGKQARLFITFASPSTQSISAVQTIVSASSRCCVACENLVIVEENQAAPREW